MSLGNGKKEIVSPTAASVGVRSDFMAPRHQNAVTASESAFDMNPSKEKEKKKRKPSLTWEDKFALLRQYKKEHGHANPPSNYVVHGVKLVRPSGISC